MPKNKPKKSDTGKVAKNNAKGNKKQDNNKFLDAKMKEFFEIIDDNIDVFKRLKDK